MKVFPKSFSLNIFGRKTPVKVVNNLAKDHSLHGLFSKEKNQILIAEDQSKEEAVHTLVHEILHAMSHRGGLSQALSHDIEEVLAEQIATVICENFTLSLKKK